MIATALGSSCVVAEQWRGQGVPKVDLSQTDASDWCHETFSPECIQGSVLSKRRRFSQRRVKPTTALPVAERRAWCSKRSASPLLAKPSAKKASRQGRPLRVEAAPPLSWPLCCARRRSGSLAMPVYVLDLVERRR